MNIAIVGSGISGLTAAYLLSREHEVSVFEKDTWLGGHTHTVDVATHAIDTGFIVFNERTYPNFCHFLEQLGVSYQPTDMSFSIFCEQSRVAYNSSGLRGYFSHPKQLASYHHWYLLYEINSFNRRAEKYLLKNNNELSLSDFVIRYRFSDYFQRFYLGPLIASIWSMPPEKVLSFPAVFLFRFLANHGLLSLNGQLPWHVVSGGSREYVRALQNKSNAKFYTGQCVTNITRQTETVTLHINGASQVFDKVILATHSDQALKLLEKPSEMEKTTLSAIPYQKNYVTLHTDQRLMPPKQHTWASWNYFIPQNDKHLPKVNYHMNALQGIKNASKEYFVTLSQEDNTDPIRPECILDHYIYEHPIFTEKGKVAQAKQGELNGQLNTYFCGAYWRYGFHEDGVVSALKVAKEFGITL